MKLEQKSVFTLAQGALEGGFKMFLFAEVETGGYFLIEFNNVPSGASFNLKSERPDLVSLFEEHIGSLWPLF